MRHANGEVPTAWLEELFEFLRIPSISAQPSNSGDVRAAADWIVAFVTRAGGSAAIIDGNASRPVVVGNIPASTPREDTPTVIIYGHFDVQPPGDPTSWTSPPFEPEIRDGWIYARGVADDKGAFYCLLKATALLAEAGRLPVNVRVLSDGEEEILGDSIVKIVMEGASADACLIYDGLMPAPSTPAFVLGMRGLLYLHLRVRTGERDLHSGHFGGVALNAVQVLVRTLHELGSLEATLIDEAVAPIDAEVTEWLELAPGRAVLAATGGRPRVGDEDFYRRRFASPAIEVAGVRGGEAGILKTLVPCEAEANVSVRITPGQDVEATAARVEHRLRSTLPEGAELEIERWSAAPGALTSPELPAFKIARRAFEEVAGARPLLIRTGGTIPIMSALEARGIPTVLTGLDLPGGNAHAPNERFLVEHLALGVDAASAMLTALGDITAAGLR